ncbi:plant/protein (DUF810) isoform X2 [Wolffia australiana]
MSMEELNVLELLQRYRRDRRVLLNFILSGNLIKKVAMPPGATSLEDIDLDQVSIDFVLNCAKKGEMLDLSEAIRVHYDSFDYPPLDNTSPVQEFFLSTSAESSGPAPSRAPPPVPSGPRPSLASVSPSPQRTSMSSSLPVEMAFSPSNGTAISRTRTVRSDDHQELTVDDIEDFEDDEDEDVDNLVMPRWQRNDAGDLRLGFSHFPTGLTDDDLRETAYEILVSSAGASGGLIVPAQEKKKEKKSKLLRKLARSRTDSVIEKRAPGLVGLLETMRIQLEISEAMDIRTRKGLLNALIGKVGKRMDMLLIPLELLCSVSRTEFSDKKAFLRWQKRQLNLLEEGLINHPVVGFGESGRKANDMRILLRKIEESELLPQSAGEIQRAECLRSLRDVATSLAERPARGDLTGDVCHWADGYHLNVLIYEKMLLSVFDILDEGKLTEEVEEILELLRSTWRILGITETIHDTCFFWVQFRQFVITGEERMLHTAIQQLRRIPTKEQRGPQERLHLKNLHSKVNIDDGTRDLTFLQEFLLPIQKWTDKKLKDYHLHFSEGAPLMTEILSVAVFVYRLLAEESDQMRQSVSSLEREQIEGYITSSTKSAFSRVLIAVETRADTAQEHVLRCLAEDSIRLLKKDAAVFLPILKERHPQAPAISASIIHNLYGNKLRPFLDCIEHLTEDAVSVLPAAVGLERYIMSLISSTCEDELVEDSCIEKLTPYQIESTSGTLVMRWVNTQLGTISSWVERSIQQEHWNPISPQQRHGSSVVEVYRIVEETVNQFFDLKVPMRVGELNGLLRGLNNTFREYTHHIVAQIGSREDLIPPVPVLTRYKKETGIKALVWKETPGHQILNERKSSQINVAPTSALCVQLNTLHYAVVHLNNLEDNILERWTIKERSTTQKSVASSPPHKSKSFEGSRKDLNAAIDKVCEFIGTKIVFWDMRETFIENLYRNGVSQLRLDVVIEALDTELRKICELIVDPLRDRCVTGLLQAFVDGLVRVLLDGGPSRIFFPNDAKLLDDDLEALKEFFISGGDGLPRGTVENLLSRVRPIIALHGFETRTVIEELRAVGQGGKSRLGVDSETLIRILCHRTDSEASMFLKKQYKIPSSAA